MKTMIYNVISLESNLIPLLKMFKILLVTTENEQKIYVFSTPSVALNLGHRLVKIAKIKIGNAIRQINNMMKKKIERYLIIHG